MAEATIDNAEIFAAGTWKGLRFTIDDLDGIVKSFDVLNLAGKVPIKLAHTGPDARKNPRSEFALGWVQKIWRSGTKLFAKLTMPQKVKDAVKDGFVKHVSIELTGDVRASNTVIPWVLDAVALLGTTKPAVGILNDLQALAFSANAAHDLPYGELRLFSQSDYVPFSTSTVGDRRNMPEGNGQPTTQELLEKITSMQTENVALRAKNEELSGKVAQFSSIRTELDTVKTNMATGERARHREAIDGLFANAIKAEEIVPAAQEKFKRIFKFDDDETIMSVTLQDVKDFITDNPNPLPRRKSRPTKASFSVQGDAATGHVQPGLRADEETLVRARALLASQGKHAPSYLEIVGAVSAVFSQNKELGSSFKFLPDRMDEEPHAMA